MPTGALRDSRGRPVEAFSVTAVRREWANILATAIRRGAVALTQHKKTKAVVLSVEQYQALLDHQTNVLGTLDAEFDALYEAMQPASADASFQKLLDATPKQLGQAALKGARKRG